MNIQVLVSTMHRTDKSILREMNIRSDAVVINQCGRDSAEETLYNGHRIQFINSAEKGLSRSRNNAVRLAAADICLFADDDLIYCDNYPDIVLGMHQKYAGYDIIAFQAEGIGKRFKKYCPRKRRLNFLTSMKVSSVEITFKRKSITERAIEMDELFGAGAKYRMGEENLFLCRCMQKGLKILYLPIKIADLRMGESTWFSGFNEKYFFDRGAVFAAMSKRFSKLLILQFAARHFRICAGDVSLFRALRLMSAGREAYLKEK